MEDKKTTEAMKEKWRAAHYARMARLKQVAANIDRGANDKYFGADFHLAFNYIFGEIVALQKEFNERFASEMQSDVCLAEFDDRLTQIMESSEAVLLDSISPVQNKKRLEELAEHNRRLEQSIEEKKMTAQRQNEAHEKQMAEDAARAAKKNKRSTYRR